MKISLDSLLVLDAIARKGSFAAAAEELDRVPSAITYTVQKFEQDQVVPDPAAHTGHARLSVRRGALPRSGALTR
jgi:hypothetical protein